jgi:hypothetical protein
MFRLPPLFLGAAPRFCSLTGFSIPMLAQPFLSHLESSLSDALLNNTDPALRRHWCDGILLTEWVEDYLPEYVRNSHQIVLRAWIDEGRTKGHSARQQIYHLIIQLGPQAFHHYMAGESQLYSRGRRLPGHS